MSKLTHGRKLPLIPPNFFGIAFGLAGLEEVWTLAAPALGVTDVVGRALALVATAVWAILLVVYFSKGLKRVREDWRNPIVSPFLALVVIVPTLLAGALSTIELPVGRVLVAVLSSITIAVGGWSTGQWIINDLYDDCTQVICSPLPRAVLLALSRRPTPTSTSWRRPGSASEW